LSCSEKWRVKKLFVLFLFETKQIVCSFLAPLRAKGRSGAKKEQTIFSTRHFSEQDKTQKIKSLVIYEQTISAKKERNLYSVVSHVLKLLFKKAIFALLS